MNASKIAFDPALAYLCLVRPHELTRQIVSHYGRLVTDHRERASPMDPGYRLSASGRQETEDERLGLLEQLFDPASRRRRDLVQPGWCCLEVGAGRGSMAVWLAQQVGPTGEVVATDIDVGYLSRLSLPNLKVLRHDILADPLDTLGPEIGRAHV